MGIQLFGWYIGRKPEPVRVEVEVEKRVEVEKFVDRVVLGTPAPITVYRATCAQYESDERSYANARSLFGLYGSQVSLPIKPTPPAWEGHYFASCEHAFAAHPGAKVKAVSGWRIGDHFVMGLHAFPITIQGKPKVAKGRAK